MRLIAIDTETTGASPAKGDRCVEIGAVEIFDGRLTGRTFQTYLNPDHPVAWQAQRVHGLTNRMLSDKPRFAEIAPDLLDFIGDAPCIAHNARFDRDMILYDFRHAGLRIPSLRFFDSLPFARAQVRAPSYKLDQLAITLGVMEGGRGLHGALEDADILGRVLARIEERRSGAIAGWLRGSAPLSPYPKGWDMPRPGVLIHAPVSPPAQAPRIEAQHKPASQDKPQAGPDEQTEADRIAQLIREALTDRPELQEFAKRLSDAGILMRPVINGDLALHGVRFSTPKASFTGGVIGLTGPALERAGPAYRHADHAELVARLVTAHDAVMGPVTALKGRFTAIPSGGDSRQVGEAGTAARERLHRIITSQLPGTRSVFDLADRLEKVGVITETRLDTKRMRVSSVLFIGEGARLPGSRVGLRLRDRDPEFWSLHLPGPIRMATDGSLTVPGTRARPPEPPAQIGEGVNPGVAELIKDLNTGVMRISLDTVSQVRSGRDIWSAISEQDLLEILSEAGFAEQVGPILEGLSGSDRGSALRWVCRGLDPEITLDFHLTRQAFYEARNAARDPDPTPEP